jgi:transposase-like protein
MVFRQMVVDAVLLKGRSVREVARSYGVSKTFVAKLVKRFKEGGAEALEPRSRAHRSDPNRAPIELEDRIVELRKELADYGVDAGRRDDRDAPLARADSLAVDLDDPSNPRAARLCHPPAKETNEVELYPLRGRPTQRDVAVGLHRLVSYEWPQGPDPELRRRPLTTVARQLRRRRREGRRRDRHVHADVRTLGIPRRVLTDNGAVYNAISRQGRTAFESLLDDLGVIYKHSRPYPLVNSIGRRNTP